MENSRLDSSKNTKRERQTADSCFSEEQLQKLENFGHRVNRFQANFAVCSREGELLFLYECGSFRSEKEKITSVCSLVIEESKHSKAEKTVRLSIVDARFITAILRRMGKDVGVLVIDLGEDLSQAEDDGKNITTTTILTEMLELWVGGFQAEQEGARQIEMLGTELAKVYEELVLLYKLSTNMRVTRAEANFLQVACDNLTAIVSVEGIAIFVEKKVDNENRLLVTAGSGLIDIDERTAVVLQSRLEQELQNGGDALLDSEVDSPFKYEWPANVRNIIAVPLCGAEKADSRITEKGRDANYTIGLMVAINRIGKQDFDSTDVKLFNAVANGCAVFVENGRLFKDLKELFIGALRALTSSIDAKDQYTRGHSERVASVSRWIAERLAEEGLVATEQIHEIYLAGLLHDIGKIGINEAVLRKKGKLTQEELRCVRNHPQIGASILREIKQMRDIVPGVLYHHEHIDGRGYPNGLVGDEIPLIGKIVGLADSFDAMTSKRTYREALTLEQALQEIEDRLGTQFDEKVGRVFINSDVYHLWDIIRDGFGEIYGGGLTEEYGTVAVGTLIT